MSKFSFKYKNSVITARRAVANSQKRGKKMKAQNIMIILFLLTIITFGLLYIPVTLALSDDLIKQSIETKAADTIRLRGTRVDLAVADGNVVLFGEVGLYIQKMFYEKIAWKNQGVIEVDNEIRVVPRLRQTDAAVERRIMEVIQTHGRFKGVKVAVTVETGDVYIRINLDHPSDILFLKHRVAEIEGVISIDIQAKFFA
jgi:osmotically-inducible protein OsmY